MDAFEQEASGYLAIQDSRPQTGSGATAAHTLMAAPAEPAADLQAFFGPLP